MLRHAALCLLLALQCTLAIEWEELSDRIQDHHDDNEFPEGRDEWFWDDHFWRYPHMMRLECPEGYGWEGNYKDGECVACQAGHHSASWGPTVRCVECPPGTFQPNTCSTECMRCPEWAPFSTSGSLSQHSCKMMPEKVHGDLTATIEADIEAQGDFTFLNGVLEQLSGYEAHDMMGHVEYDSEKDISHGKVKFVMAERAAYEAHMYVQDLRTMLPLVNDWIATGHAYVNRIFSMLNLADSLYLLGLNMDPSEIHRQMRNLRVTKIDSKYHQNCKVNQVPYDMKDDDDKPMYHGLSFCKEDDAYKAEETSMMYLSYTGESHVCSTLGGRDRLGRYINSEWDKAGCKLEDDCHMSLMRCEYDHEKKESWVVVYAQKKYGKLNGEYMAGDAKFGDEDVDFTFNGGYYADDCPGGPKNDGEDPCDEKCGDYQEVSWANGRCSDCPFGSYWCTDSQMCRPCGYITGSSTGGLNNFIFETYNSGSVGKESCIKYYGDHGVEHDIDVDQVYHIGRRPFDIPRDNRQRYKVHIEAKLSVCYAVQLKEKYADFCSKKYDDMGDLSFDDFTNFDVTKLSCLVMHRMSDLYESNCEGRQFSWPHTDNFYWLDAACMAAKHVKLTEERCKENGGTSECEEVDESIRVLTMPFTLGRGFSNDLDWGSILIPLLQHIESMTKADFSTATAAVEGAMKRLGVYRTSRLTGLEMSDYLRDVIIGLPKHLKMSKGSWEMVNNKDDVYCENGNVKMDCRSACAIPYNQCRQQDEDDYDLTCIADECNNCAVSYTYVNPDGEPAPYTCVETCQELLYHSDNSILTMITANPEIEGDKLFHFDCNEGYRLQADDVDLGSCMDEKSKSYSCDSEGVVIGDAIVCQKDKCELPTKGPENGFIKSVHASPDRACRYVEMACNPGFELKGDPYCYCDMEGNWPAEMPTCVPVECDGEDTMIENGELINALVGSDMSWYRCDVNNPSYKGETDYFAANTCGESIVCGKHDNDHCPPMIEHGYKVREWMQMPKDMEDRDPEHRIWHAEYRCEPNFMIEDHDLFSDHDDKHGWSQCSKNGGNHLPTCIPKKDDEDDDEMKPCKMPEVTYNGRLVEEYKDDDGKVTHGKYMCDQGFKMVETHMGDQMGFCRKWDHSYELPYCVPPSEYFDVEFELVGGYAKMQNAGRVKARHIYNDGTEDDWYTACDDHFNSPAAGSVCRTLGYNYGKMIDAPKKMRPIKDVPFGITNFWCYYDDVLPQSPNCHFEDYGQLGWPLCMPEEQIAVSCFDVWWNVDVRFQLKSRRKHKMFCPVTIEKEGIKMKTKRIGLHATWGGLVHNKDTDEYEYTEFKEGVHYEARRFSKKKGFRAIFIGNIDDYDCFYCNIHLGEHWLNSDPDNKEAATNHNCGA